MVASNPGDDRETSDVSAQRLFVEAALPPSDNDALSRTCCGQKQDFKRYRWVTVCLMSLGMIIIHAQRVNVAVSLLAVSNAEEDIKKEAKTIVPLLETSWTALQISLLHSGFFAGYLITQIPAGLAAYYLSAHRAFGGCIAASCLLNFLLPISLDNSVYGAVMTVRFLQGMAEGFLWPASFILINNWSPVDEVNRISGFVATGSYAGPILGFPICGAIAHFIGWQYTFYISGATGLLWVLLWWIFGYEKPDHHPKISEYELMLLRKNKSSKYECQSWRNIPWKSIAASRPFIAMCSCAFAKGWVFNMLLMQEPTYMHVFGFTIAQNGVWSAMPFFFKLLVCFASGFFADFLVNKELGNRTHVRKLFNTIGFGIESACLFSLSFIYDGGLAIAVLSTGISLGGLSISGWQTNHLDLAPQLAGILVAVTQMFSNLAGIFSPLVAGYFIQQSSTLAIAIDGDHHLNVPDTDIFGWHMIFLISSLMVAVCCAVYAMFASGDEQEWAEVIPPPEEREALTLSDGKISTTVSYQTVKSEE